MEILLKNIRTLLFKELKKYSNLSKNKDLDFFYIKRKIYAIERISKMLNDTLLYINYMDKKKNMDYPSVDKKKNMDYPSDKEFDELLGDSLSEKSDEKIRSKSIEDTDTDTDIFDTQIFIIKKIQKLSKEYITSSDIIEANPYAIIKIVYKIKSLAKVLKILQDVQDSLVIVEDEDDFYNSYKGSDEPPTGRISGEFAKLVDILGYDEEVPPYSTNDLDYYIEETFRK